MRKINRKVVGVIVGSVGEFEGSLHGKPRNRMVLLRLLEPL